MKPGCGVRLYGALACVVLISASCSPAGSGQTQASLQPRAEAQVQKESVRPDTVVTPPITEPKLKPNRKPAAVRATPVKPEAPSQPQTTFTSPAVVEREQPPVVFEPEVTPSRAPEPPADRRISIPSGTLIPIRMVDSISSDQDHVGQTFRASLDGPVVVDGETVIPKRADAFVKVVAIKAAGELTGKAELKVQLESIVVGGKRYTIDSNVFYREGASQTKETAKKAGIGAAIGAAVGAIAGGRKGAIIGAGAGAGSGVAIEAVSKNEQARIESETRVDFRLEAPLEVVVKP